MVFKSHFKIGGLKGGGASFFVCILHSKSLSSQCATQQIGKKINKKCLAAVSELRNEAPQKLDNSFLKDFLSIYFSQVHPMTMLIKL
jgi:hypothetical protein